MISSEEFLIPLMIEAERVGHKPHQTRYCFGVPSSKDVALVQAHFPKNNLDEFRTIVRSCLANDYFVHANLGKNQDLQITDKGFQAAKEKQKEIANNNSKSVWLKISDFVNEHNGIFTLLTAIVAIAALVISIVKE